MIPAATSIDHPELFAVERARLIADLDPLSAADWRRPTACPDWDLLGIVVHLVGDDFSVLARGRDGHAHGEGPPAGEHAFIDWLDALQQQWVTAATRRISSRLAVELLQWSGALVVDHFRSQDPTARTASVSWASDEPVPVWLDQARDLSEYWIHRQQIRESVGLHFDERADVFDVVLDTLRWAYPHRLRSLDRHEGDVVEITVIGRHAWVLTATGAGWSFDRAADGVHGRSVARQVMSPDVAWRSLTNNLPQARRESEIESAGDPLAIEALTTARAIIGHPH